MIKLKIHGQLFSKSNSRVFSQRGGKPILFKRKEVLDYVEGALWELKPQLRGHKPYENPVYLKATIYYRSKRSDLDVSLLQDILEKAGVYLNDRQVYKIECEKRFDKENPRCLIEVDEYII